MNSTKLRTLQILVVGLIVGVLVFAVITYLINPPRSLHWTLRALIGTVAAVSAALAGLVVPRMITRGLEARLRHGNRSLEQIEEQLVQGLTLQTIISAALVESGILLNLVFNFLEPNYVYFICAIALLAIMALCFPTDGGVQQWMAARREAVTGRRTF